jgi:hypothetical protein
MNCSLSRQAILTVLLWAAAFGLYGCAQPPERPHAEPIQTTVEREELARHLEDKGELAEALVQWKILETIEPANAYYQKQVIDTGQRIEKKSKSLMFEGVTDFRRGAREAARLSFLKVLALNPRNKEALEYLRRLSM